MTHSIYCTLLSIFRHQFARKLHFWLAGLLLTGISFQGRAQNQQSVTIAVAASLSSPFHEIKAAFEQQHSDIDLTIITASSGKITTQILHGAPYDIFFSADMHYPQEVQKKQHAKCPPEAIMQGQLVFWSREKMNLDQLTTALNAQKIKTLAIAQPELAPYGKRAMDWLKEHHLSQSVSGRLVYGESINQVNQYIKSGAVDAAFTAISAMKAENLKGTGYWLPLTVNEGDPHSLDQGMVVLTNGKASEQSINSFLQFLHSTAAQDIFSLYGYLLP